MVLRIILILGIALILLSGGAMGWQYWQGPQGETVAADAPAPAAVPGMAADVPQQNWLISPGGGLVDREAVANFLRQDRFAQSRNVSIRLRAPLTALLAEGEQLPGEPYREVFADIRARALAGGFCPELTARWASACTLDRARVAEGSYDAATGTAEFDLSFAYAETTAVPLPDLATHALFPSYGRLSSGAATPETLLAEAAEAARQDCAAQAPDPATCRVTRMRLAWDAPGKAEANWEIAWLAPLPAGMYPAPPLY